MATLRVQVPDETLAMLRAISERDFREVRQTVIKLVQIEYDAGFMAPASSLLPLKATPRSLPREPDDLAEVLGKLDED